MNKEKKWRITLEITDSVDELYSAKDLEMWVLDKLNEAINDYGMDMTSHIITEVTDEDK